MIWPFHRRRPPQEVAIDPEDAYAYALGFLRAGGVLSLDDYLRLAPGVRTAFQRAGTALRAEAACAVARALSGPAGFAEIASHFDPEVAPEGVIGEALLDEHMRREMAGVPR